MSIDDLTRPEVLGLIIAVISLLGGGAAWFMRRRRRVRARTLLDEVDEVYSRFKMNSRRCEAELYRLKDVTFEKLKAGEIDESSYDIIKERIGEYMHEIRERIVDERLGGFPGKLRDELHDMIKRGEISEKEYETLGRLIERTEELKETDKAQLRELLEKWKRDYMKKETLRRPIERKRAPIVTAKPNPIFAAAGNGDVEQVKGFLKEDPGLVNARDMGGSTPLHYATHAGHAEVVEMLLDKGAEVNVQSMLGYTPLHGAAGQGHAEVVELLLNKGAEVDARGLKGETALQMAEQKGHTKVAELLRRHEKPKEILRKPIERPKELKIREKPQLREPPEEAIFTAAENGDVERVKALLKEDPILVNWHTPGAEVYSPLWYAAWKGHVEVVRVLLAHGANVNLSGDEAPLRTAAGMGHVEVVRVLLAHGANVNTRDNCGSTALHFAASKDQVEAVELLLAEGADANARDNEGYTALQYAERKGRGRIIGGRRRSLRPHAKVVELLRKHEERR